MPKSSELQHATAARGRLIYRRQDDARGDNADYEAGYPAFDGEYGSGGSAGHVGEFDPYTVQLLEASEPSTHGPSRRFAVARNTVGFELKRTSGRVL